MNPPKPNATAQPRTRLGSFLEAATASSLDVSTFAIPSWRNRIYSRIIGRADALLQLGMSRQNRTSSSNHRQGTAITSRYLPVLCYHIVPKSATVRPENWYFYQVSGTRAAAVTLRKTWIIGLCRMPHTQVVAR